MEQMLSLLRNKSCPAYLRILTHASSTRFNASDPRMTSLPSARRISTCSPSASLRSSSTPYHNLLKTLVQSTTPFGPMEGSTILTSVGARVITRNASCLSSLLSTRPVKLPHLPFKNFITCYAGHHRIEDRCHCCHAAGMAFHARDKRRTNDPNPTQCACCFR
jgi:hypothetical protein